MYNGTLHDLADCDVCLMYAQHVELHPEDDAESNQPRTIAEAIEHGRRLQQAEDHEMMSRYRAKVGALQRKYDQEASLAAKFRDEAEALRVELEEVKDHLMALQMAYEELAVDEFGGDERIHGDHTYVPDDTQSDEWTREDSPPSIQRHKAESFAGDDTDSRDNWTDDGDFDVFQQLKLMEQWDKEDAEWFEARQKEYRWRSTRFIVGASLILSKRIRPRRQPRRKASYVNIRFASWTFDYSWTTSPISQPTALFRSGRRRRSFHVALPSWYSTSGNVCRRQRPRNWPRL